MLTKIKNEFERVILRSAHKIENRKRIEELELRNDYIIGKHTYIAPTCVFWHKTVIGKYCSIADNVHINIGQHPTNYLSSHPLQYLSDPRWIDLDGQKVKFDYEKPTIIENDVWIGVNAVIMSGIKIENGAIIGSNAVVTKDVPPYAIVDGVPAKIIRYRFSPEIIEKLLELKWWDLPEEKIKKLPFDNVEKCIEILSRELR